MLSFGTISPNVKSNKKWPSNGEYIVRYTPLKAFLVKYTLITQRFNEVETGFINFAFACTNTKQVKHEWTPTLDMTY